MPRKTVEVKVRTNKPEQFSKLLNKIMNYDNSLGAGSVLQKDPDINMKLFAQNLAAADELRRKSEASRALSESQMQQAKNLYGTAKGQGINTDGTLYYQMDLIKKTLLKTHKGNEEALSNYGFNVVIGQSKSPVKKK